VKKKVLMFLLMVAPALVAAWPSRSSSAQEAPKPAAEAKPVAQAKSLSVYHLVFVVRELDGSKVVNSRTYALSVLDHDRGKIRAGSRVPVQFGENNFQYQDVGINIDCRVQERESGVLLDAKLEMPGVASPEDMSGKSPQPVFRNLSLEEQPEVPLGKPTIIGRLDDVGTNHHFEFEVTATKVE
jgi:hypothetical protein